MTAFGCKADSNDELETGPLIAAVSSDRRTLHDFIEIAIGEGIDCPGHSFGPPDDRLGYSTGESLRALKSAIASVAGKSQRSLSFMVRTYRNAHQASRSDAAANFITLLWKPSQSGNTGLELLLSDRPV